MRHNWTTIIAVSIAMIGAALAVVACQSVLTPAPTSPSLPTFTSPSPTSPPPTPVPPTTTLLPRTAALSELQNEVSACSVADAEWEAAASGQLIQTGGGVRTGREARARLDLSDGTIIRMAATSEFELRELSPGVTDPVTRLKLTAGKLWAAVTEMLGGGEFEIETPAGLATVRGSYASVEYSDATGQMIVTCLEGECRLTGVSGQSIELSDGQQSEIPASGQDPAPAKKMNAEQYADWAWNFPEAPAPPVTSILLSPGEKQCSPNTVPAGVVHFTMGVGRWKTAEEAAAAIGDSWPTITLDDQPVTATDRTGPEWHTGDGDPGWGFSVRVFLLLDPGEYTITSQWYWSDVFTCTITATNP